MYLKPLNKIAMLLFLANLGSLFCVLISGFLAYDGKDGWGWFLFAAICLSVSSYRTKKTDDEEDDSDDEDDDGKSKTSIKLG
jgi:hypothetical protein